MAIVQDAETYLADPKTQDAIVTFVQQNLCSVLPEDASRTCQQEARVFVAQAVASMEQSVTPQTACTYLGACTQTITKMLNSLQTMQQQIHLLLASQSSFILQNRNGPIQCTLCKFVMPTLIRRFKDPESHAQIHDAAIQACDRFDDIASKAKCQAEVEQLFASLDSLLDDVDPIKICEVMQFCGAMQKSPEVFVAMKHAVYSLQELPVNDPTPENCESCKNIVEQVSLIILDPANQKEIFDYLKKGCEALQSFEKQCKEYVEEYGPVAIDALAAYLQPDEMCARLGYCADDGKTLLWV